MIDGCPVSLSGQNEYQREGVYSISTNILENSAVRNKFERKNGIIYALCGVTCDVMCFDMMCYPCHLISEHVLEITNSYRNP